MSDRDAHRLQHMMQDSAIALLLTQEHLLQGLPAFAGSTWLLEQPLDGYRVDNPEVGVTPEDLAYVIYTSGSTGKPKGTLQPHHNVLRLFAATEQWFQFGAEDVWSLFHSYAFDFSVWEIFGALLYGGQLLIVPQEVARSAQDFYPLLCSEGVTVLNQTPSAFRQLMHVACSAEPVHRLRYIVFGGEALEVNTLSPSSVLPAILEEQAFPKAQIVRTILGQIMDLSPEDPATLRSAAAGH